MSFVARLPRRSAQSVLRELEPEFPMAGRVLALSQEAASHDVFGALDSVEDVHVFMAHHVWAVWDFMSLLKSIQSELAPVRVPWWPPPDAAAARFINEIAAGAEGDDGPDGIPATHFSIYIEAMSEAGADLGPVQRFLAAADLGFSWDAALDLAGAPGAAADFVRSTFRLCERPLHERVAAFTLGREELIPAMFEPIIAQLSNSPEKRRSLRCFLWYLQRHLTVDENHQGPLSAALLEHICFKSPAERDASLRAAESALQWRLTLWDAALAAIRSNSALVRSAELG